MQREARRKVYCKNCGNAFYPKRKDARFDSARCRAEYSRQMRALKLGYKCAGLHRAYREPYEYLANNYPLLAADIASARMHTKSVRLAEMMIMAAYGLLAETDSTRAHWFGKEYEEMKPAYMKGIEEAE